MIDYDIKRKELEQDAKDYMEVNGIRSESYIRRYVEKKMNHFVPMVDVVNHRLMKFNPAYFEITDIFDNLSDQFDMFIITQCEHFVEVKNSGLCGENNDYVEVMKEIQSKATIIFFLLINIPLSRMNSLYCFATALVPLCLNIRTKYWFYQKANGVVKFFFRKDKEATNHV